MHEAALKKTISIAGSINKLAKHLGISRLTISAWLNRNIRIRLEYAIQIHWYTKGEVDWSELVTPNVTRILKRCSFTVHNNTEFETIHLSLSRIKYLHKNYSCDVINSLLENIKQHGLQNPICIDAENNLIFGTKRLKVYELLGKKTITTYRLSLPELLNGKYNTEEFCKLFSISDRIAIALALENFVGTRKGQRTDLKPSQNFDEVKGRTDTVIAKLIGFGNRQTYHQAKKVIQSGNQKLIDALDKSQFTISVAVTLLKLSQEEQNHILSLDSKKIIYFANQLRKQKSLLPAQSIGAL